MPPPVSSREGYYNSIQIYPRSEGALYPVYAVPGQFTNTTLEPGESLTGARAIAAGDTARWIIGDTEGGSGTTRRVQPLKKKQTLAPRLLSATQGGPPGGIALASHSTELARKIRYQTEIN